MAANQIILVVDDHDDDRALLQALLESQGYVVLLADNGESAQDVLKTQWVDFVISDVLMPVIDGVQLCRMIKNNAALSHITVVLYTSMYSTADDLTLAKTAGADRYMIKPIEPTLLLEMLAEFIRTNALQNKRGDFKPIVSIGKVSEEDARQYNVKLVERLESEVKKLAEEVEKRKSIEKELRDILDSMMNAVITINEKGEILTFNSAAEELFGYSSGEVVGGKVNVLMEESIAARHDSFIDHYLRTGESALVGTDDGREVMGKRKNSEVFPLRLLVSELQPGLNGKKRFIGSCHDLTALKSQDEQLRRSQKMDALGKLTGGIAHDYNNMLGVITGFAELLERELTEQPKLERYAQQIMHAGKRGIKLTKKLLSFTRKKNSGAEIMSINDLLQGERHMLMKVLTARIDLKINLASDLWLVSLDPGDLEDALLNLTINAMHAIEGNGTIIIQTNNAELKGAAARQLQLSLGEYVVLSLKDSGCGMSREVCENIFDPFFSTKGEQGTGLGLSQVHAFVGRSGGAIDVHSRCGEGTLFALYFPRSKKLLPKTTDVNKLTQKNLKGNETLLIVDDEPALNELAACILKEKGYVVLTAGSAKQALLILNQEYVDLVISDVIMPDMDGHQFIEEVKLHHPAIKVQMVSGYSDSHDHLFDNDSLLLRRMLQKPYDTYQLLISVRQLLDEF